MLKKMLVVAAILLMAGTVFGAFNPNKFGDLPSQTIPDPADPNLTIPNPAYEALSGTDRTVDWEADGNNVQRKGESWNWPATYDFVPITEVDVRMDVGFWIRLSNCSTNRHLDLKQRLIRQYGGSLTCSAQTNVATEWKADFKKKSGIDLGGYNAKAAVDPSTFPATGSSTKTITIKLRLDNVDLDGLPAGQNCLSIGTVVVSVRPTVRPNSFMSGCAGDYPVYSPPPIDSSIPWF